jgi:hypothetical protein
MCFFGMAAHSEVNIRIDVAVRFKLLTIDYKRINQLVDLFLFNVK